MAGYYAELNVNLNISETKRSTSPKSKRLKKPVVKKIQENSKSSSNKVATKIGGLMVATSSLVNSAVGEYTGNKVRQQNVASTIGLATTVALAFKNPVAAGIAVGAYSIKRTIDIEVNRINSQQESAYRSSYRGKATTSSSRWG